MSDALNQEASPALTDGELRLLIERIDWRLEESGSRHSDATLFGRASDALKKYAQLRTRLSAVLRLE